MSILMFLFTSLTNASDRAPDFPELQKGSREYFEKTKLSLSRPALPHDYGAVEELDSEMRRKEVLIAKNIRDADEKNIRINNNTICRKIFCAVAATCVVFILSRCKTCENHMRFVWSYFLKKIT